MSKEAMKLAIEALENIERAHSTDRLIANEAIKALEEALVKQEQGEPVAHINQNGVIHEAGYPWGIHNILEPLYRHSSQQRKPLTDEQINELRKACLRISELDGYSIHGQWEFARAIEAAHGIKE